MYIYAYCLPLAVMLHHCGPSCVIYISTSKGPPASTITWGAAALSSDEDRFSIFACGDVWNHTLRCCFQTPCRKLLNNVLRGLELTFFPSDRDIYIPNCDTRGFYRKKQVEYETWIILSWNFVGCYVVWKCVYLRVWALHSSAASCSVHPEICLALFPLSLSAVGSENQYCAMMTYHFLSLPLSPPSPLSISALFPFQNLPLCLLTPHSVAPPRACSVATAGVWMSSARPCPHVPEMMVLYHAMGSER